MTISWPAVGALWVREMRRFARARSRVVATVVVPLFLFFFFGMGLRRLALPGALAGVSYENYLLPGILGMSILLSSTVAGVSLVWDREFGFLKELMVAPVSRLSILLGLIVGGVTTSIAQAIIILAVAVPAGFRPVSGWLLVPSLALALLASVGFVALGLALASNVRDMHGFNLAMSFVIFPVFLLSGALFPVAGAAPVLDLLSRLDPLAFAVDGLRACLIGESAFPLALDMGIVGGFAALTVGAAAFFLERYEGG